MIDAKVNKRKQIYGPASKAMVQNLKCMALIGSIGSTMDKGSTMGMGSTMDMGFALGMGFTIGKDSTVDMGSPSLAVVACLPGN